MYPRTRYLAWAHEHYKAVRHDIASSGIRSASWREIGAPPDAFAKVDDVSALAALGDKIASFTGVPSNEVTPALGTSHALWLAYASVLSPGDEIIVESPVYEPLVVAAEGIGARVVYTERRAEENFALSPKDIRTRFSDKTRAVSVTNLHNPTGVRTSDETLAEIAAICAERNAHLIVDEVYAPFDVLLGPDSKWPKSARRLADNVIAVASLTKVFGAGPHRIGWVLAGEEETATARATILANVGHLPFSHGAIGCHLLDAVDTLAARTRKELGQKRARVAAFMKSHPGWTFTAPDAGLFGFAWNPARRNLAAEIEAWHAETGALVVPGAFFGAPLGFRIGWSLPEEKLDAALAELDKLMSPRA